MIERHPGGPPIPLYMIVGFLFALPVFIALLRLLDGRPFIGGEEHLEAMTIYLPFSIALAVAGLALRRRPQRLTFIAAWIISAGSAVFLLRLAAGLRGDVVGGNRPEIEGVLFGVLILLAVVGANLVAWRAWRRSAQARSEGAHGSI